MRGPRFSGARLLLAVAVLATIVPSTGCVGLATQLVYWIKGNNVEAEYLGLRHKRVAVVCAMPNQRIGSSGVPQKLSSAVGKLLAENVKGIKVIPQKEIENWTQNDWDQIDYKPLAKGVKADMIVEIKLSSYSITETSVFLKGRADGAVIVHDMNKDGEAVFEKDINFEFPRDGVRTSTETNETRFQTVVIGMLSEKIAKIFYAYDRVEDFANDARFLND